MATKKTITAKKEANQKTNAYDVAALNTIEPWLSYPGNKRKLVPILMNLLPSPSNRFVDLFGGTGVTGVEAYRAGKCQEVIYNDLEYDMVLLLEWLYITPTIEIIDSYNAVKERWFGDIEKIELFEEDTPEYKEATGNLAGGAHTQIWRELVNHYNTNRIILWDRPQDSDLRRIVNAVEDKEIRRQLTEFVNGIPSDNPSAWEGWRQEDKERYQSHQARRRAEVREKKAREHEGSEDVNIFAARGDFFIPQELLFIMENVFMNQQKWGHLGRSILNKTPKEGYIKDITKFVDFITALKETPITFYSHSFTEGWIEKRHERVRSSVSEERWRNMLASLTSEDVVFIDPPYHGSDASYNGVYNQQLEIYLLAFCQLLDERDIPFVFTNNLLFENDIFKEWIKNYYAYKLKPGVLQLYKTKRGMEANNWEVFVTNFKPAINRAIPKMMLEKVKGYQKRHRLKWSSSGERTR